MKLLTLKTQRQTEWVKQIGPISKSGVLSVTTLYFFESFVSVWEPLHKELVWCTNYSNDHIYTRRKHWNSIWGCLFLWVSLKSFQQKLSKSMILLGIFDDCFNLRFPRLVFLLNGPENLFTVSRTYYCNIFNINVVSKSKMENYRKIKEK